MSLRGGEADEAISKPEIAAPAKSTSGLAMTILLGALNKNFKLPAFDAGFCPAASSNHPAHFQGAEDSPEYKHPPE